MAPVINGHHPDSEALHNIPQDKSGHYEHFCFEDKYNFYSDTFIYIYYLFYRITFSGIVGFLIMFRIPISMAVDFIMIFLIPVSMAFDFPIIFRIPISKAVY